MLDLNDDDLVSVDIDEVEENAGNEKFRKFEQLAVSRLDQNILNDSVTPIQGQ